MTYLKSAILVGAAVLAVASGVPAKGARHPDKSTTVQYRLDTGWGASGYGKTAAALKPSAKKDAVVRDRTRVPEPSNLLMLGIGFSGLIAGRMIARRRKRST